MLDYIFIRQSRQQATNAIREEKTRWLFDRQPAKFDRSKQKKLQSPPSEWHYR